MKRAGTLLMATTMLGMFTVTPAQSAKKDTAAVMAYTSGIVQIQRAGQRSPEDAKSGMFVNEGDSVITKARSRATLSFANGVETRLNANTSFTIEPQVDKSAGSAIKMAFGRVWTKVLQKRTKFDINTPVATISVRGTEYETGVGQGGRTEVKVFDGVVDVKNKYGSVKINKNSKSSIDPGAPPAPPTPLENEDTSGWQDEMTLKGSLKITLDQQTVSTGTIVQGTVQVLDTNGKKNTSYAEKVEIESGDRLIVLSEIGRDKWEKKLQMVPSNGEVRFAVRVTAPVSGMIYARSNDCEAAGIQIEATKPGVVPEQEQVTDKTLEVIVTDKEGKTHKIEMKFKVP